jgi:peptide/nickel transport system permease protein
MPNAAVVVVNAVALNAIALLSGVIVVESVFGYPGLGQLLVQAIVANDFPKIEAVAVVTTALLVLINLLADGVVLLLDPRLRTRVASVAR